MRLARGRVAGQNDDASEQPSEQQVDGPNARREIAGEPNDRQVT